MKHGPKPQTVYEPVTESGCWIWSGNIGNHGYGELVVRPLHFLAHRLSWEIHNGDIPEGMHV